MALAVCTLMITAVGSALFMALRQEQRTSRRLESALAMRTVECSRHLATQGFEEHSAELLDSLGQTWSVMSYDRFHGDPPQLRHVYYFTPKDGYTISWSLQFHYMP